MRRANVEKFLRVLVCILKFGCTFSTIFIIYRLFSRYDDNEDASPVTQVRSWQKLVFPSISLCFASKVRTSLYNETYIRENFGVTSDQYFEALLGDNELIDFDKIGREHDFEMTSINFHDIIKTLRFQDTNNHKIYLLNGKKIKIKETLKLQNRDVFNTRNITIPTLKLKYQDPYSVCLEYPANEIRHLNLWSVVFYLDISKLQKILNGRLFTNVYHANQMIRTACSLYTVYGFSGINEQSRTNRLVLDINSIRLIKNRKDANKPCNEALKNDDEKWMSAVVKSIGCTPFYWKTFFNGSKKDKNYITCNTTAQLKGIAALLPWYNEKGLNEILSKYLPPCEVMQITANSNLDRYKHTNVFKISFHFR